MSERRFPPPRTVEEYKGISYIVRDANNFAVAYVYFESEPVAPSEQEQTAGTAYAAHNVIQCIANQEESSMSHSEARFLARMLFGRTRTLSDEQRSEQSERARKTITKEEWPGGGGGLDG